MNLCREYPVTLLADLEEVVPDHSSPGTMTSDATERLPCLRSPARSVVVERWITPQHAAADLLLADLRAGWN